MTRRIHREHFLARFWNWRLGEYLFCGDNSHLERNPNNEIGEEDSIA